MKVEKDRLEEYLKKIHPTTCPLCGNSHWAVSDVVFQATEFNEKGFVLGGPTYPMISLSCDNCGNTFFINALVAKLIDPQNSTAKGLKETEDKSKVQGDQDG